MILIFRQFLSDLRFTLANFVWVCVWSSDFVDLFYIHSVVSTMLAMTLQASYISSVWLLF
jgi:hypothetical protein